ncbi:retrovirus-related pol polyprotein from transposon TNT 1-94 [Tanacetum coccineum]
MAEVGKIKIDKFDGHDFRFWKMQIKDYLYQKKLHEPLAEAKPIGMKAEDWTLLDRQALGVVRLSLARNVAYNVVNEKATYSLIKALSNMYEKPIASNKVFLIRQLMSVDIKFDDEVQALLLLSSFPESWSYTVTTISGSIGTTKLKFDNIRDLILGEDICRKTSGEYLNSLLSAEDKGRAESKTEGRSRTEMRHFQNQCPKPVASNDKEVHMVVRDYDDALVCCVENTIEDRIMDSGASFHATYCKEELESWTLKDVRYIPGLKRKLISFGQLDEEGYHLGFGDQQWKVTKGSLVVARGNKRGSLYMVEVPYDGINAAIDGRGNATLWHQRLGHMSEKGMKILASKGRIPDLQKAVVGFCEPCVLGKQKKVSFVMFGNTRKLQRLDLVHTNVYGPTTVASLGGSRYYVTFIDDSSRKCLKSDNGEEYSSREFIEYCAENEIRMLKTVPETPQENGVAERMNRTLIERAKSMRLHAGLPKMFWEDSVNMAAYLINRGPSVPFGFRIPEEEWQGKEVSLTHLRVFGCDFYVKVKDVSRDNPDAKSMKCTFIGYGSNEMGYRFWDSKDHKVIRCHTPKI